MKNLGKFTLFVIVLVAAFLTSLLATHVILSIATLYQLSFITSATFLQVLGLLYIISIVMYRYKKTEDDLTMTDVLKQSSKEVFVRTVFLLLSWGLSFLAYSIIA